MAKDWNLKPSRCLWKRGICVHPADLNKVPEGTISKTWDLSCKSFWKLSRTLHRYLRWITHFHSDISCSWIFHLFQSQWLSSQRPWFFYFFFHRIPQNLECHTRVLSAYLAAKQSHEVKECILLLQSSLKRIGKQVPARPLTLPPCGGVRLWRRSSRFKL